MKNMEWMNHYMADAERLITENRVDEGLSILHSLLYEEPGYASLHNHIGWAQLYFRSDTAQAELHFRAAIAFDPAFAPPYLHLANLYNRVGRYTNAREMFERGLSCAEANRVALLEGLALSWEMQREFGRAIRFYKEAIAASAGPEFNQLNEGIKRCRRKRWVLMFF
ncbi:MAG: hypothetical protein ACK5DD_09425 [Cyclobacteriaceae bacterium]|jgi:tetratricopeptide (TPR) repeat protein